MKLVVAIIQPDRIDKVIAALHEEQIRLFTVSEVMGPGRPQDGAGAHNAQAKRSGFLRKIKGDLMRRVKVEVAVSNSNVWQTVDAISRGAHTGKADDGKVFVLEMDECLRIRTGETGVSALA
jgi:nitrogen regulatory protein P-II 2